MEQIRNKLEEYGYSVAQTDGRLFIGKYLRTDVELGVLCQGFCQVYEDEGQIWVDDIRSALLVIRPFNSKQEAIEYIRKNFPLNP